MSGPFEFSAGVPSLNLVDTVASRDKDPRELLRSPLDLDRWFRLAGFDYKPPAKATPPRLAPRPRSFGKRSIAG